MPVATWSVASTVRGRREYVEDFVQHFLALGAREILVYFDDPAVAYVDELPRSDRVRYCICDARYWARVAGTRPTPPGLRQSANVRHAFSASEADWLLHVDLDERLHVSHDVGHLLGPLGDEVFSVAAPTLEAIYATAPSVETAFRTPWFKRQQRDGANADLIRALHGDLASLTRNGLFGHVAGKSFVRTSHTATAFDSHGATPLQPGLVTGLVIPGLELLHFDALTFADWREKWAARIEGEVVWRLHEKRSRQLDQIRRAYHDGDEATLRALYEKVCVIGPHLLRQAVAAGVIERRDVKRPGPPPS